MTLSKLAQLANVSVAVVSKAFAGKDGVSEAMREHVFAVAREHGCFQQFYHARYDKPVIAVIIPEAISKYYIKYIETLKKDIEKSGYTMLLSINNFDTQLTEELVKYYSEHIKVDGLIIVGSRLDLTFGYETAAVSILTPKKNNSGSTIALNYDTGVSLCIDRLLENGHKKIAYVGEILTAGKEESIINALALRGISVNKEFFFSSELRFEEAGMRGVDALMALDERPSAILGAYGYITQGIIERLSQLGLRVPEDISVVSMDDDPSPIHRSLSVAYIPSATDEICAEAIDILKKMMNASDTAPYACAVELKTSFFEGETIGKCE